MNSEGDASPTTRRRWVNKLDPAIGRLADRRRCQSRRPRTPRFGLSFASLACARPAWFHRLDAWTFPEAARTRARARGSLSR
jgi:hypothetical protein